MILLHRVNEPSEILISEVYIVSIETIVSRQGNTEIHMTNGNVHRVIESVNEISELIHAGWDTFNNINKSSKQEIAVTSPS